MHTSVTGPQVITHIETIREGAHIDHKALDIRHGSIWSLTKFVFLYAKFEYIDPHWLDLVSCFLKFSVSCGS